MTARPYDIVAYSPAASSEFTRTAVSSLTAAGRFWPPEKRTGGLGDWGTGGKGSTAISHHPVTQSPSPPVRICRRPRSSTASHRRDGIARLRGGGPDDIHLVAGLVLGHDEREDRLAR